MICNRKKRKVDVMFKKTETFCAAALRGMHI